MQVVKPQSWCLGLAGHALDSSSMMTLCTGLLLMLVRIQSIYSVKPAPSLHQLASDPHKTVNQLNQLNQLTNSTNSTCSTQLNLLNQPPAPTPTHHPTETHHDAASPSGRVLPPDQPFPSPEDQRDAKSPARDPADHNNHKQLVIIMTS